jgi:metallo-beta-lactamase family protein
VELTYYNAGHVLGSALVRLDLSENGVTRRLVFTGDLGREELPLLQSPEIIDGANILLSESTYGDRLHPDIATMDDQLGEVIRETVARKGRVFIPTFALERAQEVLFSLERLHNADKVPDIPIYIDSPMAIAITEIYRLHPEWLAKDVRERFLHRDDPFSPPGLRYVSEVEESKALQADDRPCIVIAGSGMCEGGRIVFHLREGIENPRNSVVIVGFMAQHTLGRRLVEGRSQVRVLGVERDVRARVHSIGGLSAHADRDGLLNFADATARAGRLTDIALVHGEEAAKESLAAAMRERVPGVKVTEATRGLRIDL